MTIVVLLGPPVTAPVNVMLDIGVYNNVLFISLILNIILPVRVLKDNTDDPEFPGV